MAAVFHVVEILELVRARACSPGDDGRNDGPGVVVGRGYRVERAAQEKAEVRAVHGGRASRLAVQDAHCLELEHAVLRVRLVAILWVSFGCFLGILSVWGGRRAHGLGHTVTFSVRLFYA